jgi:hypothetical protein
MSKANTWEYGLLALLFNNVDFTEVGDSGGLLGSATAGNLYVSPHTGDPSDGGNQTTNEVTYGSYARVAVPRNSSGWTVLSGGIVNPTSAITFPTSTSGSETGTFFGVGTASVGTGKLLYSGPVLPALDCSSGETPELTTDTEITED